jgi:hypothetical protein
MPDWPCVPRVFWLVSALFALVFGPIFGSCIEVAVSSAVGWGAVGWGGVSCGNGASLDGAPRPLARADLAASICAFKLGFAITLSPLFIKRFHADAALKRRFISIVLPIVKHF